MLPVAELCAFAREKNVLSLVDGAQAFGVLDVDLSKVKPDFFTGSMHKWPCGPKEKGVLFVNKAVHDRIAPSIYGVYGGAVGISKTFEAEGQRDDAAIAAVVDALKFQGGIGRAVIEQRARGLATHLMLTLASSSHRSSRRLAWGAAVRPTTESPPPLPKRRVCRALSSASRVIQPWSSTVPTR